MAQFNAKSSTQSTARIVLRPQKSPEVRGFFSSERKIQLWSYSARRRSYKIGSNTPVLRGQATTRHAYPNSLRHLKIQFWGCSARRKAQPYSSMARICNNAMRPTIGFSYFALMRATVVSNIRFEKPHSLSYQLDTFTKRPFTLVNVSS